ncbi:MAG TPA: IS4 family transposase, partial [Allocoleopsis sp.]
QDKESQRWLNSLELTAQRIPSDIPWIMVGDREADIYELFMLAYTDQANFLVRAAQNRVVQLNHTASETLLLETAIGQIPVSGQVELEVCRTPERAPRSVTLSVRFATLELQPPRNRPRQDGLLPLPVQVILAEEECPPAGEEAIRWLLLTTLEVNDLQDARQCLRWYSYRWLIERYHYVLKSGCHIEQLQLETADRIERALATYAIVAWRLLWLTYLMRQCPEQACDNVFEPNEWQALYCTIHHTSVLPLIPPTLHECVRWIAQLGGFIGRKGDGEPGVKTIWRGLKRLHDIAQTWQLAHLESGHFSC